MELTVKLSKGIYPCPYFPLLCTLPPTVSFAVLSSCQLAKLAFHLSSICSENLTSEPYNLYCTGDIKLKIPQVNLAIEFLTLIKQDEPLRNKTKNI